VVDAAKAAVTAANTWAAVAVVDLAAAEAAAAAAAAAAAREASGDDGGGGGGGIELSPQPPLSGTATLHDLLYHCERVKDFRQRQAPMCRAFFKLEVGRCGLTLSNPR
jgi:hypothetical protein